jgi:hypothetical protein
MFASGIASACPEQSDSLIFHSCWGKAKAEVLLLPEDRDPPEVEESDALQLIVTGAYTGTEPRGDGLPNPVGLFVHGGQVINPNLARMDGVLVIDPDIGVPEIYVRTAVGGPGGPADLTDAETRRAFAEDAAERGYSVLQSHLLVVDGELDIRPVEDAPLAVRRFLILDDNGFGIAQTSGRVTLYDAGVWVMETYGPRMALNLDMGSYDYCFAIRLDLAVKCGVRESTDISKLSNLLRLSISLSE